jgi:phage terminase large subunit
VFPETPLLANCLDSKAKTIVNQGGTRSMKTWSVLMVFIIRAIQTPNYQAIIVGRDVPFLKLGPVNDIKKIIEVYPEAKKFMQKDFYNQGDKQFNFLNGSWIKLSSFENEDDVKISDIDDALMNEANSIKFGYHIYRQLLMRTRGRVYIDYNPAAPFWVHDKLIGKDDVDTFYSDHRSNQFIPQYRHDEIEKQRSIDFEWWKVYGLGLTGNVTGIIYPRRSVVDRWPEEIEEVIWGIDYGYSVGATAILKTGIDRINRVVYEKGCSYQPGIEADQIVEILKANGWNDTQPLYSEHDPEKVTQLRSRGVIVYMARKGELSEFNAISKLRNWESRYIFDENLNREYQRYQFESVYGSSTLDGTAAEVITNKVKDTNQFHYMAAKRYAQYTHLFRD